MSLSKVSKLSFLCVKSMAKNIEYRFPRIYDIQLPSKITLYYNWISTLSHILKGKSCYIGYAKIHSFKDYQVITHKIINQLISIYHLNLLYISCKNIIYPDLNGIDLIILYDFEPEQYINIKLFTIYYNNCQYKPTFMFISDTNYIFWDDDMIQRIEQFLYF